MSVSSSCLLVYIEDEHIYFVSLRKSELLLPCFISQLSASMASRCIWVLFLSWVFEYSLPFLGPFCGLPNVYSVKDDVEQGGGVLLVDLASWGDEDADCPRFDHTSGCDGSGGRGHACRCVRY